MRRLQNDLSINSQQQSVGTVKRVQARETFLLQEEKKKKQSFFNGDHRKP